MGYWSPSSATAAPSCRTSATATTRTRASSGSPSRTTAPRPATCGATPGVVPRHGHRPPRLHGRRGCRRPLTGREGPLRRHRGGTGPPLPRSGGRASRLGRLPRRHGPRPPPGAAPPGGAGVRHPQGGQRRVGRCGPTAAPCLLSEPRRRDELEQEAALLGCREQAPGGAGQCMCLRGGSHLRPRCVRHARRSTPQPAVAGDTVEIRQ